MISRTRSSFKRLVMRCLAVHEIYTFSCYMSLRLSMVLNKPYPRKFWVGVCLTPAVCSCLRYICLPMSPVYTSGKGGLISMAVKAHYYTTSFFKYLLHHATLVWGTFLLLTMAWGLWNLHGEWQGAQGWEQQSVAQGIEGSHGFSYDASHRWMFVDFKSAYSSDEYFPTALVEPVYPTLMAIFFKALGDYGKLAILVFQVISLLITCVVIYHLGRILFNSWTGILAG